MGRWYTVEMAPTAVTAQVDLFEIQPADDQPCRLRGWTLAQTSDAGDAQAELLGFTIIRGFTTSGSGGRTPTPAPIDPTESAASFRAETVNTTLARDGTGVTLWSDAINVQAPAGIWLPEEAAPVVRQGLFLVMRLDAAPADSLTLKGTLVVEEI